MAKDRHTWGTSSTIELTETDKHALAEALAEQIKTDSDIPYDEIVSDLLDLDSKTLVVEALTHWLDL
jgi:hypothetical protein